MQYTINKQEKHKAEIKVDIPKDVFEKTYGDVLAAFGKDAKIAGFRPGNAPEDVLESHVGHTKLLNETASFLVNKHVAEILKKEDLAPLDSPQIAVHSLSKGSPFSFTASFIQRPKVKLVGWKKVKVKKQKAKNITDDDVNLSIKNIHEAWTKQKTATTEDTENKTESTEEKSGRFIYDAHGNKIFIKDEESKSKSKVESPPAGGKIDDEFAKAVGAKDLANLKEIVRRDLEAFGFRPGGVFF